MRSIENDLDDLETRLDRPLTPDEHVIYMGLRTFVRVCHERSYAAGWWLHPPTSMDLREVIRSPKTPLEELLSGALVGQKIALCHSELSEALEGARKDKQDDHLPFKKSADVELGDVGIRVADLCGALGYDFAATVIEKLDYNGRRVDHKLENRILAGGKAF